MQNHHHQRSSTSRSTRNRRSNTLVGKLFTVKLGNNNFYYVVETDSGRYYDITDCAIHTDGSVPQAIRITESYAKALIAAGRAYNSNSKRKASAVKRLNLNRKVEEMKEVEA